MSCMIKSSVMGAFATSFAWSVADIGVNIWAAYHGGSSAVRVQMVLMSIGFISTMLHFITLYHRPAHICPDLVRDLFHYH